MFFKDLTVNWALRVSVLSGRDLEKQNWRWMVPLEMFTCAVLNATKKTSKPKC